MEARGIHHLGVAVEDLDEAVTTYERLFGARVELLASLGEETAVGKFLAKRGPGMHHVAYEVDDLRSSLAELEQQGAELIDASPRRGLFGLEVAFVHPDSAHGVLAELVSDAR
jgi:methylmalonyl-CoA/ethylmalonyl-CoA epimerase